MSTRKTTVFPTSAADDKIKQANVDVYSYSGSHISNKSISRVPSQRQITELREKYIDEKFQLELLEAKLRHRRELLKIRKETDVTRAEKADIEFEQASDLSIDNASRIRGYIDDCQIDVGQDSTIDLAVHSPPEARTTAVNNAVASALQPLIKGLELPRVELAYFDGNPIEYWKFMRQFEFYVESKVANDGQRLLYLLHYCKWRANEAISECIMLPPTSGFERARRILGEHFGQTHHVARSLLDRLLNESNAVVNSSDALSSSAIKMENCHIALTEMNYAADSNSLSTLEKLTRNLPRPLQFQWAEFVDKITLGGGERDFLNLLEFVSSRARVARSRFGQLARRNERSSRDEERPSHQNTPAKKLTTRGSVYASQSKDASPRNITCQLCKGNHGLSNCGDFIALSLPEREAAAKTGTVCFMCLEPGHRIYDCRTQKNCIVENCGAGHHRLLHNIRHLPSDSTGVAHANCGSTNTAQRGVILGMIPVRVVGPMEDVLTYAFLDSGSDTTLVSQELIDRLNLTGNPSELRVSTITSSHVISGKMVALEIRSLDSEDAVTVE
ncbi:hypothetical protein PHET_09052, partial [Paragonimus heterotremus]